MTTIDTHAHLDHLPNLDQALKNAQSAGVDTIVCVSMDLESSKKNLEIKKKYSQPKIYLAMGMHPEKANLNDLDACLKFAQDNKKELHAIGEIGLDFWYKWIKKNEEKKDEQRKVFRAFLELAKELNLPAIIHSRGAWAECLSTVKEIGVKKVVFHWYSGPVDVLNDIMSSGYFVSTSPSVAYSPQSREAMAHADIHQTLIETDSPVFFKGGENDPGFAAEPKDVLRTLKAYCDLRNIEEEKAAQIFTKNAKRFFNFG